MVRHTSATTNQVQHVHGLLLSALTHQNIRSLEIGSWQKLSSKNISQYFHTIGVQPQDVERRLLVEIDTNINISLFIQHSSVVTSLSLIVRTPSYSFFP